MRIVTNNPQMQKEVGRSVFRNRIIRFVRSLTNDKAPVEVMVDLWKLEGKQFNTVPEARTFAHEFIREQDGDAHS